MIYKKHDPKGVDIPVQNHQIELHKHCKEMWKLSDEKIHAFGRIYRNQTTSGYIPEFYDGDGKYKEVLLDTHNAVQFFYGDNNTPESMDKPGVYVRDMHLVMMVNLEEIRKNVKHRPDVEAQLDVLRMVEIEMFGMTLNSGVIRGVQRVFEEYPGMAQESIKYTSDMHPWHCFRFNLRLKYKHTTSFTKPSKN